MAKSKAGQTEFGETPSPAIRNKILSALDLKEQIGERHSELKKALDEVRKMMRDDGRKSLTIEDSQGDALTIRLVPTGEKVTFSKAKKKEPANK